MTTRLASLAAALALIATACGGGDGETTILVDFSHDEFSSIFVFNFPTEVKVRQGADIVFKQTWTGEPHTVTGGSLVSEKIVAGADWIDFFEAYSKIAGLPNPDAPGDATTRTIAEGLAAAENREAAEQFRRAWDGLRASGVPMPDLDGPPVPFSEIDAVVDEYEDDAFEGLPWALDDDDDGRTIVTQNAGRPCFLTAGLPPEAPDEPCADQPGDTPVFDGSHTYFSSGIIPFEGPEGNTFRVSLAEDLEPGIYSFYCAVHGFTQRTEVEVVGPDEDVPTPAEVAGQARREIEERAREAQKLYRGVLESGVLEFGDTRIEGPFAGLWNPELAHVAINEFIPKRIEVEANEPITWKLIGPDHTISFDVPSYFPIVEFLDDGTIRLNPQLAPASGGAPDPPPPAQGGSSDTEGEPVRIDGGTWDGSGFWSSGLVSGSPYVEYTVRVSTPGTYKYACLLHPPMVGTIVVT